MEVIRPRRERLPCVILDAVEVTQDSVPHRSRANSALAGRGRVTCIAEEAELARITHAHHDNEMLLSRCELQADLPRILQTGMTCSSDSSGTHLNA